MKSLIIYLICRVCRVYKLLLNKKFDNSFDYSPYVLVLYNSVKNRLEANDIDQEIKECAIIAMGTILSYVGDKLEVQLPVVLPMFLNRLKNDATRMSTMKKYYKYYFFIILFEIKYI